MFQFQEPIRQTDRDWDRWIKRHRRASRVCGRVNTSLQVHPVYTDLFKITASKMSPHYVTYKRGAFSFIFFKGSSTSEPFAFVWNFASLHMETGRMIQMHFNDDVAPLQPYHLNGAPTVRVNKVQTLIICTVYVTHHASTQSSDQLRDISDLWETLPTYATLITWGFEELRSIWLYFARGLEGGPLCSVIICSSILPKTWRHAFPGWLYWSLSIRRDYKWGHRNSQLWNTRKHLVRTNTIFLLLCIVLWA